MIQRSIDRIKWRLSKPKAFTPNMNDAEACNELIEYVNDKQKEQYHNYELFAKLYIYLFTKVLMNDKTSVFDNSARRKIGNVLKKPISQLIQELTDELNFSEMYVKLEDAGFKMKYDVMLTDEERISNDKINKEIAENKEKIDYICNNAWEFETIEPIIIAEVNAMIELHKT